MNKTYVLLLLLLPCAACAGSEQRGARSSASETAPSDVEVVGAEQDRERHEAIEIVDAALRKNGDLGAYGDLSVGIAELSRENHVRITLRTDGYWVEIVPHSNEGHDVTLRVDPQTLKLHDVAVGEIAPPEP